MNKEILYFDCMFNGQLIIKGDKSNFISFKNNGQILFANLKFKEFSIFHDFEKTLQKTGCAILSYEELFDKFNIDEQLKFYIKTQVAGFKHPYAKRVVSERLDNLITWRKKRTQEPILDKLIDVLTVLNNQNFVEICSIKRNDIQYLVSQTERWNSYRKKHRLHTKALHHTIRIIDSYKDFFQ